MIANKETEPTVYVPLASPATTGLDAESFIDAIVWASLPPVPFIDMTVPRMGLHDAFVVELQNLNGVQQIYDTIEHAVQDQFGLTLDLPELTFFGVKIDELVGIDGLKHDLLGF